MSRKFLQHFEREFRLIKKGSADHILAKLINLKARQPSAVYPELVRALKVAVPSFDIQFHRRGKPAFRDLWWHSADISTPFENELIFAVEWFRDLVPLINAFRQFAKTVESLVLSGEYAEALKLLRDHRDSVGWTAWHLELEIALMTEVHGSLEVKKYLSRLSEEASPRLASLMAAIFKDRCDESISLGAFIAKCDRSIPHVRLSQQTQEYLYYRAYGYLRNVDVSPPAILTMALMNSFIDHYEAFIDICASVLIDDRSKRYIGVISESCAKLVSFGISDSRLHKLYWLSGGLYDSIQDDDAQGVSKRISRSFSDYRSNLAEQSDSGLMQSIFADIAKLNAGGVENQAEIDRLYLIGTRFRGLSFGVSIAGFANRMTRFSEDSIGCAWGILNSGSIYIGDVLALELRHGFDLIANHDRATNEHDFQSRAERLLASLNSAPGTPVENFTGIELLWLARQLLWSGNYSRLMDVVGIIANSSDIREHQKISLQALLYIDKGEVDEVMELMADALIEGMAHSRELPLSALFNRIKWSELKGMDVISVGLVSHYAHTLLDNPDTRYIVRMACRSYYNTRVPPEEALQRYEQLSLEARRRLVIFLSDVWIEDNLTMAGFQSTQEVREDRIKVLQILLQLNFVRATEYREEIKNLTFELNLWKGLKHINETRIFVNEAAIARWAEKELGHEFQRWQRLRGESVANSTPVEGMVLKYLTAGSVDGLFAKFSTDGLTEADTVLMNMVERLFARFLTDPTDGLNCYLSSRIRHGTLKGTLLGPLEEAGFIGQTYDALRSEPALKAISPEHVGSVINGLESFGSRLSATVTRLIKDEIQVRGVAAPRGKIYAYLNPTYGLITLNKLAENLQFSSFVTYCFDLFWSVLGLSLEEVSEYIKSDVKMELQHSFDDLIDEFRGKDNSLAGLVTTLQTVATATQAQCDMVANWFSPNRSLQQQEFSLFEAIEVARKATKNVYRSFPDEVSTTNDESLTIPLTPLGLSAVTDCLYVLFENAWKHSGLGSALISINVHARVSEFRDVLILSVTHEISDQRRDELERGALDQIRTKYIDNASMDMASLEGGSGIAKIVRLTRSVQLERYPRPVTMELCGSNLEVTIHLPIYERQGAYDAYFE